jgi:hypothetical protein
MDPAIDSLVPRPGPSVVGSTFKQGLTCPVTAKTPADVVSLQLPPESAHYRGSTTCDHQDSGLAVPADRGVRVPVELPYRLVPERRRSTDLCGASLFVQGVDGGQQVVEEHVGQVE